MSFLTYVCERDRDHGHRPAAHPVRADLTVQFASSFVNRVSPANVGGMAANVRFLQKNGVEPARRGRGVGLNSVVGGIVHIVLLVVFFVWSGSDARQGVLAAVGSKILLDPGRRSPQSSAS